MLGSEILESFVVDVNESDKIITVWNNLQTYRGKFPTMKQGVPVLSMMDLEIL
jgi:hypothetical protein